MCESTRKWIMGGVLAIVLVLAAAALVADRMWLPRAGSLQLPNVASRVS